MPARIWISMIHDPYVNLAIENELLAIIHEPTLFIYQNYPCVVIGRAQNPWQETDMAFLKQNQIPLVRRQSGGGTVVHDLGNVNFSFLSPKTDFNKLLHAQIVQRALKTLQISVDISDRYDLFIGDKKISGSAFRETRTNSFHHGTLLINSNLDFLRRCLKVPERNIVSKAIPSRRSPVMNLSELVSNLEPMQTIDALVREFVSHHQLTDADIFKFNSIPTAFNLTNTLDLYQSEDWLYLRTLPFTEMIDTPEAQVKISVEHGLIVKIEPDHPNFAGFLNQPYHTNAEILSLSYNTQTKLK